RSLQSEWKNGREPACVDRCDPQQRVRPRTVGLDTSHLRSVGTATRAALTDSPLRGRAELRLELRRRLRQQPGRSDLRGVETGWRFPPDAKIRHPRLASF